MVRILLVADSLTRQERTGIDRYYYELIHRLPLLAPNFDFILTSLAETKWQVETLPPNLTYKSLPLSRQRLFFLSLLNQTIDPIKWIDTSVDLVHLLMPIPIASSVPILSTIYDLTPLILHEAYPWHVKLYVRKALRTLSSYKNYFTTISQCTTNDLLRLFPISAKNVQCILLGVNDEFHPEKDVNRIQQVSVKYQLPPKYFLFIGSMHKRKNLLTLLKAFQKFKSVDTTSTKLVLAGRMSLGGQELKSQILEYGLQSEVLLPGYIDEFDLPVVISSAVALIYPSLYEGFGLPALEAMACGTPVIASRISTIFEVTHEHAILCDPLDPQSFANAMLHIISDSKLRDNLVENGLTWAKSFSWEATAAATLDLYESILSPLLN